MTYLSVRLIRLSTRCDYAIIKRVNKELESKLKTLPRSPGVYFHKSSSGEVIYVGKAAVLRNRVRQYFQNSRNRDLKTYSLVQEIETTDWIETESEIDALFLESEMIKRYKPRYNVLLRDDKSTIFVRIDMKSKWPHVSFTRTPADDGAEYIGPFYNARPLRKALRYLRRVFPYYVRPPKPTDSQLESQIGINPQQSDGSEAYKANLRKLISYIKGNRVAIARELERDMKVAARAHDFETAARLRNRLSAMKELQRRVMFGDSEYLDISKDKALTDLAELLGIQVGLKRIEGFDISHHGGRDVVASMVVFTNGVSDRAQYRKFKMTRQANDDTYNIYETLHRRLSPKNLSSWGIPNLVLIDGGKGQLSAAIRAQDERGTTVPVIGIAKRDEEIIIKREGSNIELDRLLKLMQEPIEGVMVTADGEYIRVNLHVGQRNLGSHTRNLRGEVSQSPYSDIVKLFQRIRDEAHRFAVGYHTTLARRVHKSSGLDDVPGVGTVTRRKLLREFGSVRGVRAATEEQLSTIVGPRLAQTIKQVLS